MPDTDFFRGVPLNSTEPVEIDLLDESGAAIDGTVSYMIALRVKRRQDSTTKVYTSLATGADDTANAPRLFWKGSPTSGRVLFNPPTTLRNLAGDLIAYRVLLYEDATVFRPYPQERPLVELVVGDDTQLV